MSVELGPEINLVEVALHKTPALQEERLGKLRAFSAPFSERRALLVLGDTLLVLLAVCGAGVYWHHTSNNGGDIVNLIRQHWYWFPALLGGWWVLSWLNDLYYIPTSFERQASAIRVSIVGLGNLAIYGVVFFLVPSSLPRSFFLVFLLLVWPAIILWRCAYAKMFNASSLQHRILIVGQGERARSIADVLKKSTSLNYNLVGYYAGDEAIKPAPERDSLPIWGQTYSLADLARRLNVHEVVAATDDVLDKDLFLQLAECQAVGIRVSSMPDLYEKLCRKIPIEHIDPIWVLQVLQGRPVFSRMQLGLKRMVDLVLGFAGFMALVFFMPFVALAIRLDSEGPIFYAQTRSGRAGKPFRVIKFRTMSVDAEKDGKARWATENDPRVTRVGHFLRKARLDELPQVLNVLSGEMSFVGPRPERPEFIEGLHKAIPYYRIRLMVKPGLTGWAQTQYGYGNTVYDALVKAQYDMYYVRNWSLWFDVQIIFRTIGVVFKMAGT